MRFFDRVWKVTIFRSTGAALTPSSPGGAVDLNPLAVDHATALEITEMRIKGSIEKKLIKNPNTCALTIFNLAERTRSFLKERPLTAKIEAGHDGILRHLYLGDIRFADSDLKDETWETKLVIKDGGRAFAGGFITKSYSKNTPVRTIVRDCAGAMGLQLPAQLESNADLSAGIPRGVTLDGPAEHHLTELLAPYGFGWSLQNGILQTLREDQVRDNEAFIVNEDDAALIGSPEYKVPQKEGQPNLLQFKTLLWPELQPGSKVDMRTLAVRGLHKLVMVKHDFDSDSEDEWVTACEATIFTGAA